MPTSASHSRSKFSKGLGLSSNTVPSAPGFICSKPKASTQSAAPLAIAWRARNSAVDPVEQLLLTLKIGMPDMPSGYTARWPLVESP
jgi:hypothetical protein